MEGMGAGLGAGIAASNSAIQGAMAIKEANKAWQRQKTVLQNQIQWRVTDLRRAGLNPILAANSGLGAGGAPSVSSAQLPDMGSTVAKGAGAAIDALRAKQQRKESNATIDLTKNKTQTEKAVQFKTNMDAIASAVNAQSIATNTKLAELSIPEAEYNYRLYTDPEFLRIQKRRDTITPSGNPFRDIVGPAAGAAGAGISNAAAGIQDAKKAAISALKDAAAKFRTKKSPTSVRKRVRNAEKNR